MRYAYLYAILVAVLATFAQGCSSDPVEDCNSVCAEAQRRSCTSITNCGTCCGDTDSIAVAAGCQAQRDAYADCGSSVDACSVEASCSSQENALASCVAAFCVSNPTSPACTPPRGC